MASIFNYKVNRHKAPNPHDNMYASMAILYVTSNIIYKNMGLGSHIGISAILAFRGSSGFGFGLGRIGLRIWKKVLWFSVKEILWFPGLPLSKVYLVSGINGCRKILSTRTVTLSDFILV